MKFFDSFWKASFYKEGKAISFWKSFGKVCLVTFLVSISYAVCFYTSFGMNIPSYLYSYGVQALNGYPSNLVVTIEGNKLSKNIGGELHMYAIPEGKINEVRMEEVLPGYIIAINDTESASLDSFKRANALILLAKDGIVTQSHRETQILSYSDLLHSHDNVVISKDMMSDMVAAVNIYSPSIPWILCAGIIILYALFAPLGYLLLGLINGLIIMWLSTQIIKKKTNFIDSYILGMYALAPVIIISSILSMIPGVRAIVGVIPFFETIFVIAFLWCMFSVKKVKISKETMEATKEADVVKKKVVKKTTPRKKKSKTLDEK